MSLRAIIFSTVFPRQERSEMEQKLLISGLVLFGLGIGISVADFHVCGLDPVWSIVLKTFKSLS